MGFRHVYINQEKKPVVYDDKRLMVLPLSKRSQFLNLELFRALWGLQLGSPWTFEGKVSQVMCPPQVTQFSWGHLAKDRMSIQALPQQWRLLLSENCSWPALNPKVLKWSIREGINVLLKPASGPLSKRCHQEWQNRSICRDPTLDNTSKQEKARRLLCHIDYLGLSER